jgi:hypothetical protein
MTSVLHPVTELSACEGLHMVIAAGPPNLEGSRGLDRTGVEIGLASILGEREAKGAKVPVVTLWVNSLGDALAESDGGWLESAVRWLRKHGRQVIVRTRQVLARPIVEAIRDLGGRIELELAHHRPALQAALLGPGAATAAALLLQSQHLVSLGIPVWARLSPLMPAVHDGPTSFDALARNLIAADVWDVHLEVGELRPRQARALQECVGASGIAPGALMNLGRAFGLDPLRLLGATSDAGVGNEPAWRLRRRTAVALESVLRRVAESEGLRVDHCGCSAQCHLATVDTAVDGQRGEVHEQPYVSVLGPDLFSDLQAG